MLPLPSTPLWGRSAGSLVKTSLASVSPRVRQHWLTLTQTELSLS